MDTRDIVVPDKQTPTIITLEASTTDPWMLFLYALKAPATRDKYIQRLMKFLDSLGYTGTKEEKSRAFAAQARADPIYAFNSVLKFFQSKRDQIDRKETAIGTVRNYVKSIKLFCDMADVHVPWAKITRGLPRAKRFADDRAPTLQEIRKIAEYPDRRIKNLYNYLRLLLNHGCKNKHSILCRSGNNCNSRHFTSNPSSKCTRI